jgi:hypothetical protein
MVQDRRGSSRHSPIADHGSSADGTGISTFLCRNSGIRMTSTRVSQKMATG